ncbi:adenylosuccinate synthetase [Streptomyces angustmyceticus]|uniref:adenylosuccinate synthetase n=1 Tax=Streptomyces angustmyceticus TaxID=285578 RepID=UPI0021AF3DE6|nr:adenylosuccinate synthetase [Streptomyces angustmyceticus]
MPALVLLGAQWGDEGKGKATDLLGGSVDYVVRYQGGNNAGHTVVVGDQKYALHLLPSGILSPGCTPVIGNGVVVDPAVLLSELSGLNERGVDTSKLLLSGNAHLITPYNITVDKVTERFLGKRKIGTTGRGIGPRIGGERGVTTGRDRRCGWFDAVIARYATRVNGLTDFFLTKLDVLTGWEQIPVCVAYEIDGKRVEELPYSQSDFHHAKPIYETLPGWSEDITKAKSFSDLPKNAQAYVKALEEMSGAPISAIGVGPGRDETIEINSFLS